MGTFNAREFWRKAEEEEKKKSSSSSSNTKSNSFNAREFWRKAEAEKSIGFDTFSDDLNTMNTTLSGIYGGWQDKDTMASRRAEVEGMYNRLLNYEDYRTNYGNDSFTDLSELANSYKSALDDWDSLAEIYGQYENADAYNKAVNALKESEANREKMRKANLLEETSELAYMESNLRTAKEKKEEADSKEDEYISNMDDNDYNDTTHSKGMAGARRRKTNGFREYMNSIGYSSIEELEAAINEKKEFVEGATLYQEERKILNAEDFEEYSTIGRELKYESGLWSDSSGNYVTYIKNEPDKMKGQLNTIKADTAFRANPKLALAAYGTDDEYNVYNYYLGQEEKGLVEKGTADDYINSIMPRLEERWQYEKLTEADEFAHNHKVLGSIKSVGHSLAGAGEFLIDSVAYGITGELDDNFNARATSTIRGRVAKDVDWDVDLGIIKGDAFDFLYNTTMSGADSAASVATFGKFGGVALGLSAAASATNDALDRGFTDEQALKQGFMSGAFEMLFESVSIGKFLDEDASKGLLKNLASSMFVNASEETLTELANIAYDTFANGELSNYQVRLQELIDSGKTPEEAKRVVAKEFAGQVLEAGASGSVMGGGFTTINTAQYNTYTNSLGKTIRNNENVGNVVDLASVQLSPVEKSAYEAYERYTKRGINADNIKNGKLGNLAHSLGADAEAVLASKDSTPEERAKAERILQDLDAYTQNTSASRFGEGRVKELYGDKEKVQTLINNALEKGEGTKAHKLATEYKAKIESGKELSEKEITKLVDATTSEVRSTTRVDAEQKLRELGETENAVELSKIISKAATGQMLSSAEMEAIANNENARKVFAQMDKSSNIELMEASEAYEGGDAELFLENYEGGDIDKYRASFDFVSSLAKNNYDADFILEHRGALTPRQVQNIYSKVVAEPRAEQQRKLDELVKNHEGQLVRKANIDDSIFNGAKGQKLWRNLNSRQKKAITFVKAFAKGAGINLKITYNGKYNGKAYNGYYDHDTNTIVIDARAGFDRRYISEDAIIPTMSHELTHWMKQKSPELYAKLSKQIFDVFKAKGYTEYDLIATEKQTHPDMSDEDARDEIIARASEDLFKMSEEGKKIFESLSGSEQKTLVGKIKELIQNLVDWANELLGLYESKSDEAGWLREFKDELSEIAKTWDQMLAKAVEVNAAVEGEGVLGNLENGISEDGTTIVGEGVLQMSEKTYYDGGRDYLAKWLKRQKGLTQKDKDDILRQTDKVAEIMRAVAEGNELPDYSRWANLEVVKDEKGEKVLSVIVKNGDYTMNIDFSQVCKKRVALNAVLNAMVQAGDLNVHVLTETDVADLNAIIKKHDFEIACALCFVDSKRYRVGAWAESFCEGTDTDDGTHKYGFNEMVRSLVPKGSKINVDEFNFTKRDIKNQPTKNLLSEASDSELDFSLIDKIMSENDVRSAQHRYARAIKENPQIRKILNSAEIISSIGLDAIRLEAPALYNIINGHQGTAKPKFSHDAVAYGNDVLKARGFTAKRAKMVGGVRCQSFSDFQANMIMDYAQFISELAAKKLTSHAYTKEPLFVKLFGMTGMKINMSLVPKAVDMNAEQQKQFAILKDKNADKNSEEYKAALEEYEKLAENAGLDENGNYIWEDETFPYDIAMEIVDDPRYSANCGTIAVGISKAHILKLLADDKISMVIPYHKSGLNRDVAMMRDIALYHDYTSVQNTRYANDEAMYGDDAGKKLNKDKGDKDFDFYGDLYGVGKKEGTHDPKKTAQNYLDWCDKHNYTPRFDEFRDHPNYYKLLVDFRVYDTDGTYREQQAVKAIYPEEAEFKDLILNGVKDKDGKVYGGLLQSQETSDRLKAETKQIVDEYRETLKEKYGKDVLVSNEGVPYSFRNSRNGMANDLLLPYNKELSGYIKQHNDYIVDSFKKLVDIVNLAFDKPTEKATAYFGIIPTEILSKIENSIPNLPKGLNGPLFKVGKDYSIAVTLDNIRHLVDEKNLSREDIIEYLDRMADCIVEFDTVAFDYYYEKGNRMNGILFKKTFDDGTFASFEVVSNKKRSLNLQTFYMQKADYKKKKFAETTLLNNNSTANVQDEDRSNSDNSILNSPEKSNEEIVNNDGIQMSEKDTGTSAYDIMGEKKALEKRYDKLAADFANYKERVKLDKTLTKGKVIDPKQLEAVARYLVKFADSDYKASELAKMLNDLYVDIQDGAMDDSMSWDEMYSKAYEVAKEIRSEAKIKIERPALYDKILKDIRSARIAPNEGQKGDAKHRFGDHYVGKFRGRVTIANDGTPLDIKWSEWAAEYPSVFDKDIGDAQQLVELYDIYDDLRNAGDVVQEYEESEVLQSLATEIINKAWTVTKFESTADKQNKRIQELNAEHRKAMEELKDTYTKKVSDAKMLDNMYYGRLLAETKRKRQEDVRKAKEAGRERLAKYKENAERNGVIKSITNVSLALNKKLSTNSKDVHIPETLKPVVINLLNAIDYSSKNMLKNEEPTKGDFAMESTLNKVHSMASGEESPVTLLESIKDAFKLFQDAEKVLKEASDGSVDSSLVALDADMIDEIEKMIKNLDRLVAQGKPNFVLQEMNTDDLKTLSKMVRSIKHWASVADKALANKHKKRVSDLSIQTIDEMKLLGERQEYVKIIEGIKDFFNWTNLLPVNAFKRLGDSATEFFDGLRDAQDKVTFNRQEVMDFMDALIDKYNKKKINIKDWRTDVKTFDVLLPGEESTTRVEMPVSFIMSLYCTAKQEDAQRHLYGKDASGNKLTYKDDDGNKHDGGGMTIKRYKEGKFKLKVKKNLDNTIINDSIVKQITGVLTKEQIEVADAMQEFMGAKGTEWGDAVSMALYGIKKFGKENYFPLTVSPHTLSFDKIRDDKASLFSILNYGFTKERNSNASQSIEIGDIFEVFANHMNMMAIYNAYALPIYDIARWYNFKGKTEKGKEISVTQSIETAFGKGAISYVNNLIKDLNGQHAPSRLGFIGQMFKNEKVAMVGNSLSVAALQGTAYFKAMTKVSPKYLMKSIAYIKDYVPFVGEKKGIKLAKKYCGIALLKSQGYFETGISTSTTTKMLHDESLLDKIIEKSLWGAEKADEKTWGMLWYACEFEIRGTRKDLKVGSEEYYLAIGEKLRDIIYETQVVDSPLTKSDLMRSHDTGAKMYAMFASEITVAYNMVYESVYKALLYSNHPERAINDYIKAHEAEYKNKYGEDYKERLEKDAKEYGVKDAARDNRNNILMNLTAYALTSVATGILYTAVQNLRKGFHDDDDEEKGLDDYLKEAFFNIGSELFLVGKIPYFKDIISITEGFSPKLPGFAWAESAYKAIKYFGKASEGKEGAMLRAIEEIMKTFSYGTGIAVYNNWRELKGILQTLGIME